MTKIGYSCILDGVEVHHWGGTPSYFEYRGAGGTLVFKFKNTRLKSKTQGLDGRFYAIVERHRIDRPTRFHSEGTATVVFDGTKTVVDPKWMPATLAEAKTQRKAEIRQHALERLGPTDPDVLRALELRLNVPIPVATRRAAIRQQAQNMANDVDALSSIEAVDAYAESNWP